jgi:hypothetical protein
MEGVSTVPSVVEPPPAPVEPAPVQEPTLQPLSPEQEANLAPQVVGRDQSFALVKDPDQMQQYATQTDLNANKNQARADEITRQITENTQNVKAKLISNHIEAEKKLMQAEADSAAQFAALREQSRQKRYAIDPNKNRFQEGSNVAVAMAGAFIEGFIRPGQASQISKTVTDLTRQDAEGQLRLIEKEEGNVRILDDQERAALAVFKTRDGRIDALAVLKLDKLAAEAGAMAAKYQGTANFAKAQHNAAVIQNTAAAAAADLEHKRAVALNGRISANAAALNAKTQAADSAQSRDIKQFYFDAERATDPALNTAGGYPANFTPAQRAEYDKRTLDKSAAKDKTLDNAKKLQDLEHGARDLQIKGVPGAGGTDRVQAFHGGESGVKLREKVTASKNLMRHLGLYAQYQDDNSWLVKQISGAERTKRMQALEGQLQNDFRSYNNEGANLTAAEIKQNEARYGKLAAFFNGSVPAKEFAELLISDSAQTINDQTDGADIPAWRAHMQHLFNDKTSIPKNADAPKLSEKVMKIISNPEGVPVDKLLENLRTVPEVMTLPGNANFTATPVFQQQVMRAMAEVDAKGTPWQKEQLRDVSQDINEAIVRDREHGAKELKQQNATPFELMYPKK